MTIKTTIKILLINGSDNEGEHIISLFRSAGRVARGYRAKSAEELHSMLEQDNWDLLIANDKHPEVKPEQALEQISRLETDIPSIIIRDENIEAVLEAGANDVVSADDDQRLIFAALREIGHLENRRQCAVIKAKLVDAEQRSDQLLAQSQDAVAYISDGMIINSNQLFSDRFGFESPDDLDCLPIIDLIQDIDQEKVKSLIKAQQASDSDNDTSFTFEGLSQNGKSFSSTMKLGNAIYDDEVCIQICIRDAAQITHDRRESDQQEDTITGVASKKYFLEQLGSVNNQTNAGISIGSLMYIGLDKFSNLRSRFGIVYSNEVMKNLAQLVRESASDNHCLSHYCDDAITLLLPETGEEKARKFAQTLCNDMEDHIIEIGNQSIQCTISIGLLVLQNQHHLENTTLIDGAFSECEKVREEADSDGIGNGVSVYVPVPEQRSFGDSQGDDELDSLLEEALNNGDFSLAFQPIVSLRGTSGDHYEVQTRMVDEDGNIVAASEFINTIHFTGTNTRLDRWVILEATKLLARKLESDPDTRLFINLTSHALQDKTLITWLGVVLKAGDIPPGAVIFQFEESTAINYVKPAKAFAESIKAMGCKLSISSFGNSDDPLKTLKNINADFAKICGKYTKELESDGSTQMLKAMVSSIIENNSQAIVSDVENAAALAMLWQIGVDYIQGGYLATPTNEMSYEFTDIA